MAYIGAEPVPGQNREVDDISSGFNGNATAFTLQVSSVNVSPESANNILINLGGVLQNPGTDYTVNASTLTFTTAPASGLSFFGLILGAGINTATVADGTISTAKIVDQAVDLTKLPHGTGSNDGKFLRANNGADPSFETVGGDFGSQNIATTGSATIGSDLIHSGDTDTKISFGTDSISVNTGGTERLAFGSSAVVFNDSGADVDFRIEGDTEQNLFFADAGNDRIGIATNAPDKSLTIGGTVPVIKMNDGSGRTVEFRCGSTSHNPGIVTTYVSELFLGCNSTESVKVGSEHLTIQNGDLIIGTAGHGIDFSASADGSGSVDSGGELLDDYEEGSFNVNYKTGAAGSNTVSAASYASTGGLYTKIGNMVHFQIRIKCSSHTAQGGQIVIEGLPFTHVSTNIASGAYITASQMLSGSNNVRLICGSTQIEFQNLDGTAFQVGSGGVNLNNEFHCAGSYIAA